MAPEVAKELKWLYWHAIDAQHEYENALDKMAIAQLAPLFRDMMELLSKNARELAFDLQKNGEIAGYGGVGG